MAAELGAGAARGALGALLDSTGRLNATAGQVERTLHAALGTGHIDPPAVSAERVAAAARGLLATRWQIVRPDGSIRTGEPHEKGHYDSYCPICRPDLDDGDQRIVRRVLELLEIPVTGGFRPSCDPTAKT